MSASPRIVRKAVLILCLLLTTSAFASTSTTNLTISSGSTAVTTVAAGTVVSLTAAVVSGSTPVTPGLVLFCDTTPQNCNFLHIVGVAQTTATGAAVYKFRPGTGLHSYSALFLGDSAYTSSASANSALTVTGASASTAITQTGSAGNYTLTATTTSTTPATPTGLISFEDQTNANAVLAQSQLLPSSSSALTFTSNSYTVGSNPYSVTAADFNNDGLMDFAIANSASNTLTVALGTGTGTFTTKSSPATGTTPYAVLAGDFNSDGNQDLLVANEGANTLSVLLGAGDGTFTLKSSPATGTQPRALAVGDFNGDGILDAAVVSANTTSLTILLGTGDGTFTPVAAKPTVGTTPYGITTGDFNGDGILDLAVTNSGSTTGTAGVTILQGVGNGTFTALASLTTGGVPLGIATGDFNGDGNTDLAVTSKSGQYINIFLGNGNGGFAAQTATVAVLRAPSSVTVTDLNGDGFADLIAANSTGTTISYAFGKGDGTFATSVSAVVGASPLAVTTADFNGDGVPDILVSGISTSNTTTLLLCKGTAVSTATVSGVSPAGSGTHNVFASYPGDPHYSPNNSATTALTAQPVSTALTLTASPSGGSSYGQQVTLTATLNPYTAQGDTTNGEAVTFSSNGNSLGSANLVSGVATLNTTTLALGSDSLSAIYAGDTNFATSTGTATYSVQTAPTLTVSVFSHHAADAPFAVAASSNSTGAITYSIVSGPATVSGSTVTLTGTAGVITLQASQAAGSSYGPATTTTTFNVVIGSIWLTDANSTLTAIDSTGATFAASAYSGGGLNGSVAIAFDGASNAWIAGAAGISEFNFDGSPLTSAVINAGGINNPTALALDGAGRVWIANSSNTLTVLTNAGTAVSPTPYTATLATPTGLVIDTSGNIWLTNSANNTLTEFLGAATPTTPLTNALTTGPKP